SSRFNPRELNRRSMRARVSARSWSTTSITTRRGRGAGGVAPTSVPPSARLSPRATTHPRCHRVLRMLSAIRATTMPFPLAQASPPATGWLTHHLLNVTLSSAEWVLWLLAALSVLSIAVILERFVYFSSHRLRNAEEVASRLSRGELEQAKASLAKQRGIEAS